MAKPSSPAGWGSAAASYGTEEWAKRWRIEFQSLLDKVNFYPKAVESHYAVGQKFRVWALLNDDQGQFFETFEAFCEFREPWGLGKPASAVMAALELALGKQAAQLETVAPAPMMPGPGRGHKSRDTVSPVSQARTDKRLRAIAERAPEPVRQLYREGRISQSLAAKLGPVAQGSDPSVAARCTEIGQVAVDAARQHASEPPAKAQRAVNAAVRKALGANTDPAIDLARRFLRLSPQDQNRFLESIGITPRERK